MHNFVFTFFIILTLGVLTVVDARGGRHGHGKVSSMTPTPTPTAEDITKSTGSSEAVSPTSGSETAQEEGVITESPAHENVEDRGNINSILSAFADKMIHLMKENSLPAGIPESIGVPVEARNSTSQKLKVDMSQLPFAPGVEDSKLPSLARSLYIEDTFSLDLPTIQPHLHTHTLQQSEEDLILVSIGQHKD